jgi:hypothetical protein
MISKGVTNETIGGRLAFVLTEAEAICSLYGYT